MKSNIKNEIIRLAKSYEPDAAQFLREIIAIPSMSGKEGPVVERIKQEMHKVGFEEVMIDGLGNVIGRIGSGPKVIAFDAHVDTVDVGNPDLWQYDPFKGKLKDGIIYGRGASDMKGGMAAMAYAGKIMLELGIPDELTVYMVGSVQEEDCEGLCWRYIINEDKIKPELVIITEPTNLNIYRGHRGRMEMEVSTTGISCHGSAPERGENAIYKMAPIISEIENLNESLHVDEFLGKGTIAISHIRSTSPSLCAVADSATIHLDRRLTGGETERSVIKEIVDLPSFTKQKAQIKVLDYDTPAYTGLRYPMKKYYPTWQLAADHPAVINAAGVYSDLFDKKPQIGKWVFSTNGVATAGMYDIPTIGFGPANEIYAHSPDDQCPVDHLSQAMMFYSALMQSLV